MKIAVMQPYIFPYLGYFQLIHAADTFVFYDDVGFIKQGWVNRNRILVHGNASYFTIPVSNASSNSLICETEVKLPDVKLKKLLRTIEQSYSKAPFYQPVMQIVQSVLSGGAVNISELAIASVKSVCEYLGIKRRFLVSSQVYDNSSLDRAARLMDICSQEKASCYINAEGGMDLYDKSDFLQAGVTLTFLKSLVRPYAQYSFEFVPYLSIIDVLMFNSPQSALNMICNDYEEV